MTEVLFTNREATLMEALWELGPSTVSEVQAHLSDDLAYTTVLTILRNLEAKRYVSHVEDGRAHRYEALVSQGVAQKSALESLTQKLFKGSTELLMTRLVADRKLSTAEIERIKALLDTPPIEDDL